MYITQAYKGLHDWWRYIIGVLIAITGVFVFSAPHLIAIFIETFNGNIDQSQMGDTNYIMTLFESNLNLVFVLLPFAGGLLFLLLAVKYLHKQSFVDLTTTRKKIDWKRFWFIFFLWGIVSSSFVLIDYYITSEDYVFNFKLKPFLILSAIAVLLVPLQTSFEEYLFRGYLMQGIGIIAKNKWVPLIITSTVFGLLHIANPEVEKLGYVIMIYYIGTGLMLGIMTLMDEGMELSLGFHAANNLFTALLVTADWTAFQTHSIFKDLSDPEKMGVMEIFVPVFVVFPILLFILSKKYHWTNWKDKLFGNVIEPPKKKIIKS
ncbi:CPBP family intramembrane glutamic endopeptidase [Flavivirga jejuensis]|uniref:CPBP family intramembrane metalloprotease n=1 Tax=Flavivirga jejuensis TaxID=870487 RepID=A0ABT8WRS0_9FLAO|nr:CPBP family intramembrane glutamic endopeptidase [Flavivirga jejuensis]MDO5975898.1 CPBP family intramembrane metalloprotease [Flavivirga jejuensis]